MYNLANKVIKEFQEVIVYKLYFLLIIKLHGYFLSYLTTKYCIIVLLLFLHICACLRVNYIAGTHV